MLVPVHEYLITGVLRYPSDSFSFTPRYLTAGSFEDRTISGVMIQVFLTDIQVTNRCWREGARCQAIEEQHGHCDWWISHTMATVI